MKLRCKFYIEYEQTWRISIPARKADKDTVPWGMIKDLLVEEGEEVSHHYKDRPGQSKEEFADVKSPLIEIVYSCKQKEEF